MPWTPGKRKQLRELEDPFEGVPEHLVQPLFDWIQDGFRAQSVYGGLDQARLEAVAVHLRIGLGGGSDDQQFRRLRERFNENTDVMLDVAEALLELYGYDRGRARGLANLLSATNSAYEVADTNDGLQTRVTAGVRQAVADTATTASNSAGDHLTNAWNEAYGRRPDAVKSYSEAIKAVESALAQHVSPQNGRQTLGTMIRDVSAKPTKWRFTIDETSPSGVETVLAMMKTLWNGQTSRHGGLTQTRDETLDEARAAVHLAATLVQFGTSGAFKPA